MHLYVIGIPQSGGCWFIGASSVFTSRKKAEEYLAKERASEGAKPYSQLFMMTIPESHKD